MQIKTSTPEVIWKAKTLLGEGTLWVPSKSSIFFVDIKKKKILTFNLKKNKKSPAGEWLVNNSDKIFVKYSTKELKEILSGLKK